MAAVNIHSYFEAPESKIYHCFHFFLFYLPWSDGTGYHGLSFYNAGLTKLAFSLSSFTLIKRLSSSSSLSVEWYLLHIWSCWYFSQQSWSSPAFHMMHSACKVNKQGDKIHPYLTSFPILSQFIVPCPVLTVASWPAYRFPRSQVRWSGIPISLRIFQFVVIHTLQGFSGVNEAEVDVFLEFPCFLCDPMNVGSLISGFSAFSKSFLYIWKFSVHVLLKTSWKDFEHNLASMWNECNCAVVWTFFDIALLWD